MIEYNGRDVVTDKADVPEIWYVGADGRRHRYFVDILLQKRNALIEVKSTWTLRNDWSKVRATRRSCEALGYDFTLWVFGARGELLSVDCDCCDRIVWKPLRLPLCAASPHEEVELLWEQPDRRVAAVA